MGGERVGGGREGGREGEGVEDGEKEWWCLVFFFGGTLNTLYIAINTMTLTHSMM